MRPRSETFAEYLIHVVWETMGEKWFKSQASARNNRHVVFSWYDAFAEGTGNPTGTVRTREGDEVRVFRPSGQAKALIVLGYDLFSLKAKESLPDNLVERLRTNQHFQGARYELAVAAIFTRLGFAIDFLDDAAIREKHCEFVAEDEEAGVQIAVEAKSRVREGAYHEAGAFTYSADEERLFKLAKKASKQGASTKDMPLAIFLDLNVPLTPEIPVEEKPWFKDMNRVFDRIDARVGPDGLADWSILIASNFGLHFDETGERLTLPEVGLIRSEKARQPLARELALEILEAVRRYGQVPQEA